jgi:hypothetical protein
VTKTRTNCDAINTGAPQHSSSGETVRAFELAFDRAVEPVTPVILANWELDHSDYTVDSLMLGNSLSFPTFTV